MGQGNQHLQQPPGGRLILGVLHEAVANGLQHRACDERLTRFPCKILASVVTVAVFIYILHGARSFFFAVAASIRHSRVRPHHDVLQTI